METSPETLVRCPHCKEHKPQSHYQKNRAMKSGFEHWCRPCKSVDSKQRRERRKALSLCRCGRKRAKGLKSCIVCLKRGRKWLRENKEYSDQLDADYRRRIKAAVFDHYGWKCACPLCPIDIPGFLTIDHMNGGGTKHRKDIGNGTLFYRWLIRNNFPPEYQTLCYNCNCSHGHLGFCGHERPTPGVFPVRDKLKACPTSTISAGVQATK